MNKWKWIGFVCIALIIGTMAKWLADGSQIYTKSKEQIVKVDELFGTTSSEWKDHFQLGLLPSGLSPLKEALGALPIVGMLIVVTGVAFWMVRRENQLSKAR